MITQDFPERLKLRDTGLHDDMGGAGQRIYTTAGNGYNKQEYIRADIVDSMQQRIEEYDGLFDLQWSRIKEATEVWQRATGKHDVLPDLGDLIRWMQQRIEELEKN